MNKDPILTAIIAKIKTSSKQMIPFDEFMQLALYAPGIGYYSGGAEKFGQAGDFVTAPVLHPLFAQTLANVVQSIFQSQIISRPAILEFGPGSGVLAKYLMLQLDKLNALPQYYYLLELSSELKSRQQQTLSELPTTIQSRFVWLEALPNSFEGVVIANEVLDAMPVKKFHWESATGFSEVMVAWNEATQQLQFTHQAPLSDALQEAITFLPAQQWHDNHPYDSEINPWLMPWVNSLASCMKQGVALIIDYGFNRSSYYHPERKQGTLMCHRAHRAHDNPLQDVGVTDITAHVDFTLLAETSLNSGLEVLGFTNQASFLLNAGITQLADTAMQENQESRAQFALRDALKQMIMPSEMGELFKVMALGKNYDETVLGFQLQDLRNTL